jgi:hypothetical protein
MTYTKMRSRQSPVFSKPPLAHREPEHLWSDPRGNICAPYRETSRYRSLQMLLVPFGLDNRPTQGEGESRFYVGPGQPACKGTRRSLAAHKANLNDPAKKFPSRVEIEFSSPLGGLPSIPKTYRTSAINWALSVPVGGYMTIVEKWRQLPNGQIEFTMRRLPTAD